MAKAATETLATMFTSRVQSRPLPIPSLRTTFSEPGLGEVPWSWGQAPGSHLPPANFEGRGSEGGSPGERERAARGRLRLALAAPASPLPREVRAPSAQPVGGARRGGAGPRGGGSAEYIKPAPV